VNNQEVSYYYKSGYKSGYISGYQDINQDINQDYCNNQLNDSAITRTGYTHLEPLSIKPRPSLTPRVVRNTAQVVAADLSVTRKVEPGFRAGPAPLLPQCSDNSIPGMCCLFSSPITPHVINCGTVNASRKITRIRKLWYRLFAMSIANAAGDVSGARTSCYDIRNRLCVIYKCNI
jgi:hypothetical protein